MIAAPRFYAEHLGEPFADPERVLAQSLPRPLAWLARRSALIRGVALGWLARRGAAGVVVIRRQRGTLPALAICALAPPRRAIYVCELNRRPLPGSRGRRALYRAWWKLVEAPLLRRGMAGGQVMTAWEREEYAAHYGLEPARIEHLPWPLREGGDRPPVEVSAGDRGVFSSGRTACDWETLFAAAAGAGWELVVVCSRADEARVRELAAGEAGAVVHVELPWAEHERLLRAGAVCVISIADRGLSAGQVRLMSAVEAGVAVVATDVRALDGYTVAGETALRVPPADAAALRAAVDELLADPQRRLALRDAARARADRWTYEQYFKALRALIGESLPGADPPRSIN
jgi:hypothetical protein